MCWDAEIVLLRISALKYFLMCWDTEIVLIRISALKYFVMCWDTEVVLIRILVLQSFLYWYEYTSLIMNTQTISIYRISELSAVLCCVILCCLLSASAVLAAQALVTLRISAQNLTLFSTGKSLKKKIGNFYEVLKYNVVDKWITHLECQNERWPVNTSPGSLGSC